jgi:acyl-CoA synthetase (AMP-forming)/AMP-acid ligase II
MEEARVRCGAAEVSYAELFGAALRATAGLAALGVGAGDRVALLLRNSLEFLEASIATVPLGASAVPINWHWRGEEIAHVLSDSGAKTLVLHADLWPSVAEHVPADVTPVVVGSGEVPGARSWSEWMAGEPWQEAPESAPVSIIYTSGTTGKPKGVVREQSSEEKREASRALLAELFQLGEGERTVIPAPMYHTAPNVYSLACALLGMDMTIMERFDAEEFLRIVQEQRVTVVQMVPTMFVRLLALDEEVRRSYDTSSLRWIVHAAAPCPPDVKRAMIDWLGPIVAEYYGGTETGPVTYCTSEEWLAHPGTVGRAVRGDMLILDDDGRECPTGVDGTIWFRGATNFEYFDDPVKTAESRTADGETSTVGDVGHVDEDGYLYLTDRKTYMIISGGVNIYPQETENLLATHPAVLDAAVIGVPNDDLGEEVKAVVQPVDPARAGPDLEGELIRFCREHLAHFKCPRSVDFVDELPRLPTGKLYKRLLRDRYWQGHRTSIL